MSVDGEYRVCLTDDGTMDTIVEVSHNRWTEPREFRYGDTSEYRDKDGCLNLGQFVNDVVIPDAEMEE